jgi:hypothetical protein
MNLRIICPSLPIWLVAFGTAAWAADPPPGPMPGRNSPAVTNVIGPKIQFETTTHDFGKAMSGEQVKYSYVFTNGGDEVLEVTGVQACGCITADWTKQVEPGKMGAIPISFNSSGYGGPVGKTVTVTCNDKKNPRPILQFKGIVWKPVEVAPQYAVLNLTPDAPLASVTVVITNNMPEPITLSPPQCNNPSFNVELKTNKPGRDFRLVVTPAAALSGPNAHAQITLKTSLTNVPTITVTVFANVQPAVQIIPNQIVVQGVPLVQAQTNTLSFNNNSTNAITLSEPAVSAPGVEVQVKGTTPGRQFQATVVFPQGFEMAAGQKAELSIKSSLPSVPVLKVPILQVVRALAPKPAPVRVSSTMTNRHRPLEMPPMPPIGNTR